MRSSIRSAFLVLTCAIASVALVGCGGGSKENPARVLDQTFSGKRTVRSGKLKMRIGIDAQGLSGLKGPVTIRLTGPFQRQARQLPSFDLDAMLSAGGRTLAVGAISAADKGFIKFQGSAYAVPDVIFAGFKQGFVQARSTSPGIDPRRWMRHPKVEGDEDVAGQSTTHVSSDIDVPKLLDDRARILQKASQLGVARNRPGPANLTAAQKKTVSDAIERPRFDVYSGKHDRIVRRLTVAFGFNVPAKQQRRANGLKSGRVNVDLEIADVNRPEPVRVPTQLKPFSELRGALSILSGLPGLGLLVSPSPVSGTAPGPATSPDSSGAAGGPGTVQAYAQCVTAAGGDGSKEQACARLLPSR